MIVCMTCYTELKFDSVEFNKVRKIIGVGKRKHYYNDFPCLTCHRDYFVEIDDDIYKSIIKLNKKGYKTNFCCAGHSAKKRHDSGGYIAFKLNKSYFNSCPDGWEIDDDKSEEIQQKWGNHFIIRYSFTETGLHIKRKFDQVFNEQGRFSYVEREPIDTTKELVTEEDKENMVQKSMRNLEIWVDSLPLLEKKYFLIER